MRRIRSRRRNKQRKIIIISICSLLLIMTVGYAAMQTNLEIKAKGNVVSNPTGGEALLEMVDVVTSGDGLYADTYEERRYIYKGANPNNYINFNNELWRIISVESDNTIKILRNEVLSNQAWDTSNSNNWARPATLNTYLNEEYFNSLINEAQNQIINHIRYIGAIEYNNNDLASQISDEKSNEWFGNIGLVTASDVIRSNNDINLCGTLRLSNLVNYSICRDTTWMYSPYRWWTISPYFGYSNYVFYPIYDDRTMDNDRVNSSVFTPRPAVYLSPNVKITGGTGAETDPFLLEN